MSISLKCLLAPLEQTLASFMDKIADRSSGWSKDELVHLWNTMSLDEKQSAPSASSVEQKPKSSKQLSEHERCTFKITRGDKIGERCTSRVKESTHFCVKHTKDDKSEVKQKPEPVKKDDIVEHENATLRMEQKFKKETNVISVETDTVDGHTIIKGTNVVLQNGQVVGYLQNKQLVTKSNADTEKAVRKYQLVWKHDELDE